MSDAGHDEMLSLICPGLYPPPATPVALPELPAPTHPFGLDLVCIDDLAADGEESEGLPQLAQDNYHRVTTPRGKIPGYPNDCTDVRELLSKGVTPAVRASVPGLLRSELLKDKRNRDARVTATPEKVDSVDGLRIVMRCTPDDGTREFELTMTATAAATRLVGVR